MNRRSFNAFALLTGRSGIAAAALLLTVLATASPAHAADRHSGRFIVGTWVLALDAGSFVPDWNGLFLRGLAQFNNDRTLMISDAGDFAAASFLPTFATPQYGAWRSRWTQGPGTIEATSLFLEARGNDGEAHGWTKVQFRLQVVDKNHVRGTMSAFFLPCAESPPLPTPITCPDPIVYAGNFIPASPPDVPLTLTRVVPGQ